MVQRFRPEMSQGKAVKHNVLSPLIGIWTPYVYLKAGNAETVDRFGSSVAMCGDTLVVGATGEDSNAVGLGGNQANNSALGAGAAYRYATLNSWTQQDYVKRSVTSSSHRATPLRRGAARAARGA